jgi:hypothetical protein
MFLQTEMDYFLRKSLSKYLMGATDINKHNVDIFINGTGKNMRRHRKALQNYKAS